MFTRALNPNHSNYPVSIVFAVGLWALSFLSDLAYLTGGDAAWSVIAFYSMAGGLIAALAAAIPRFIDLLSIQDMAARKLATNQMTINLIVVGLYVFNTWMRASETTSMTVPLGLSIIAVVLLFISGFQAGKERQAPPAPSQT